MKFKKHVFICTNERPNGKECCGEERGMALVELFKKEIRERKLAVDIRAQRAGCIDVCANGPALVVYPEGVFYGKVEPADVAEIVESHLVNDIAVERLKLKV
ncbi:(2Fe-2S) ferredoxin domain-containing protein [Cytophaga hutchinsonii]|jgi:(2Fe-2S) ferredoxin|uniref:Ferrodoxin n=1 Tax=Cytophaga hutchinsonii (strain ATCC 33406 / DSM 1761 / CIP 103989 / NBRC 15051 / NCIMB 9469 / D465) TaxID=269798 RepID=A0A6N4SNV6_CYTH3|nr:(2Fe-2S) ferredoxin domain-containing protein [Cytophaga hutchinsonii]ABG57992.1 ferrodoxin [Cytophaga hutchinsonii ATCC 33406]SFX10895.1 (2Fe-2S) ferredoxin [Cytophaga hutchinsonii ATCC 33406]